MHIYDAPSYFRWLKCVGSALGIIMHYNEFNNVLFSTLIKILHLQIIDRNNLQL